MNIERIYQGEDDLWYFNVRGNLAKGPFTSHDDAEGALNDHVRQCRRLSGAPLWPKPLRSLKIRRRSASEPIAPDY